MEKADGIELSHKWPEMSGADKYSGAVIGFEQVLTSASFGMIGIQAKQTSVLRINSDPSNPLHIPPPERSQKEAGAIPLEKTTSSDEEITWMREERQAPHHQDDEDGSFLPPQSSSRYLYTDSPSGSHRHVFLSSRQRALVFSLADGDNLVHV